MLSFYAHCYSCARVFFSRHSCISCILTLFLPSSCVTFVPSRTTMSFPRRRESKRFSLSRFPPPRERQGWYGNDIEWGRGVISEHKKDGEWRRNNIGAQEWQKCTRGQWWRKKEARGGSL